MASTVRIGVEKLLYLKTHYPPTGLEPAIPGLGGRCLIHWATEAYDYCALKYECLLLDCFPECAKRIF